MLHRPALLLLFLVLSGALGACVGSRQTDGPRVADFGGTKVAYTNYGRGSQAVVFVHGWSSDRSFWNAQVEGPAASALRKRRLITVDLPGHGESDKPQVKYTMDYFARSIAAVMDDAGVERAVLVGHSNGTPVARQFYRLYPGRTAGLVVVDGSLKQLFTPEIAEGFLKPLRGPDYKTFAENFVSGMSPIASERDRAHVKEVMMSTPQHVMVGGLEAASDPAIWGDDPIRVPLLVVNAKSPFWTAEYEAYVRRLAPGVDYRVFDGVSHFVMMDKPAEFNAALVEFLSKLGW
jgi:pimeloyl-ACP methyl ester carboxylesterase